MTEGDFSSRRHHIWAARLYSENGTLLLAAEHTHTLTHTQLTHTHNAKALQIGVAWKDASSSMTVLGTGICCTSHPTMIPIY
jgi:hypothetical protein